jgi:catechol 2,3-dioxygenase-like lactoylglutathione lyase family enzyme
MVNGAHILLYSKDPDADRTFFRDVLQFRAVDAGHGWLIFALPPAELAVHPGNGDFVQSHAEHAMLGAVVYLMCDNLPDLIGKLEAKGVTCTEVTQAPWGMRTTVRLPSGGEIGLYQPSHPTAIGLQ